MRPEGIRKALLQPGAQSSTVCLNDGSRIRIKDREHWLIGDEYLVVDTRKILHCVAFRNIASIDVRIGKLPRFRPV